MQHLFYMILAAIISLSFFGCDSELYIPSDPIFNDIEQIVESELYVGEVVEYKHVNKNITYVSTTISILENAVIILEKTNRLKVGKPCSIVYTSLGPWFRQDSYIFKMRTELGEDPNAPKY